MLDYYGVLLTEKQKDIMDLYFNKDLSLAEISENTNTSRQAIHDIIKRCEKLLHQYEVKLQLMKKSFYLKEIKTELDKKLNLLTDKNLNRDDFIDIVEEIRSDINEKI
jgi:predicted DNA-binding protein YlxM (UPF0122 family)